jgi:hypothetical protein
MPFATMALQKGIEDINPNSWFVTAAYGITDSDFLKLRLYALHDFTKLSRNSSVSFLAMPKLSAVTTNQPAMVEMTQP